MAISDPERALEWVSDKVDAYLDGDLSASEAAQLEELVEQFAPCAEELAMARRVQDALRTMPTLRAPASVSAGVYAAAREPAGGGAGGGSRAMWGMLATAAAAVLVFGVWWNQPMPPPPSDDSVTPVSDLPSPYTAQELEEAETELRWTFAYLGAMADRSARMLQNDVFGKPLAGPMREVANLVAGSKNNDGVEAPASGDSP